MNSNVTNTTNVTNETEATNVTDPSGLNDSSKYMYICIFYIHSSYTNADKNTHVLLSHYSPYQSNSFILIPTKHNAVVTIYIYTRSLYEPCPSNLCYYCRYLLNIINPYISYQAKE